MSREVRFMIVFFILVTAIWLPFYWDDLPWNIAPEPVSQQYLLNQGKLSFLAKKRVEQDKEIDRIDEALIDLTRTVDQIKSGDGNDIAIIQPVPSITLFTADDTWQCSACERQAEWLERNPPNFEFRVIKGPKDGKSPTGKYPSWSVTHSDGNTETRTGAIQTDQLNSWVEK